MQRNTGIRSAVGEFVLLCDDDIEMPEDYILRLTQHLKRCPAIGAITGRFLQKKGDKAWDDLYSPKTMMELLWKFIFQQTVWGEIDCVKTNFINRPLFKLIRYFYKHCRSANCIRVYRNY